MTRRPDDLGLELAALAQLPAPTTPTVSTDYGQLLLEQHRRQAARPPVSRAHVHIEAHMEIGLLAHLLRPLWVEGESQISNQPVDKGAVLGKMADVLAALLALDLAADAENLDADDWGELEAGQWSRDSTSSTLLRDLAGWAGWNEEWNSTPGWDVTDALCELAHRLGFTPADIAARYWGQTT